MYNLHTNRDDEVVAWEGYGDGGNLYQAIDFIY